MMSSSFSVMEPTLPLLDGSISLSAALANADDIMLELSYPQQEATFFDYLTSRQNEIVAIVAWHLRLGKSEIPIVAPRHEWLRGNFNINIPVYIENWSYQSSKRILMRIPLPYKLGEAKFPNNVEEKLRCEVATFVWLLDQHPTVPVPLLWGFGFPNKACFSIANAALHKGKVAGNQPKDRPVHFAPYRPLHHHRHDHAYDLATGYLIMEYIEEADGQLLSEYWSADEDHRDLRHTFLTDLASIMLALSTVEFNSIGSLTFGDDGFLSLTNRPLHFRLQQLENKGVACGIPRSRVYKDARAYFLDLLACHEMRVRHQRNSIRDETDAETHFAVQTAMKAMLHSFTRQGSCQGPFFFRLTDIHPNNVLVDHTGHIKCLIDLEWAVVHPLEFVHPPVWLTNRKVDQLAGSNSEAYKPILQDFLDIFEGQERASDDRNVADLLFTNTLRRSWESGAFFYFQGMENPKTCCTLFFQHMLPRLMPGLDSAQREKLLKAWALLWGFDAGAVIRNRLEERAAYMEELRELFKHQR